MHISHLLSDRIIILLVEQVAVRFSFAAYSGVSPWALTAFTSHPLLSSNSAMCELPLKAAQWRATLCSTSLRDASAPL
jgi:hypothetical protein